MAAVVDAVPDWRVLLTPRYEQGSVTIDQLRVEVDVGTFLKLRKGLGMGLNTRLCRLIGWDIDSLTKKRLLFVNLYDVQRPEDANGLNDLCRHMPVAKQKEDVEVIEVRDVGDISFVFHHTTLTSLKYSAQGRTDSYVSYEGVDAGLPFPCVHPLFNRLNCYARRMWDEMQGVKAFIVRTVTSQRFDQSDSSSQTGETFMTSDGFEYMARQVKDVDGVTYIPKKPRKKEKSEYVSLPGGDSMMLKRKHDSSALVVDSLDGLVYLFGQAAVFGVRKAKPRVDQGVRALARNDRFSIPTCAVFLHYDNKVKVSVFYELYIYSVGPDGEVLNNCPDQFLAFLNRDPPIMPSMYPPRERIPFYEGPRDSLIGWNLDEDDMLAVGQVYPVQGERNEIIGIIDGGRMIELAAICDDFYSTMDRQDMLTAIRKL